MIKKLILLASLALLLTSCSSTSENRGAFLESNATNYLTPKCPTSDLDAKSAKGVIAAAVLECLGHDELVNLAGIDSDKPLVISFWASWCTICADDAIAFNAAYKKLNGKINFLGIAYQDNEKDSLQASYKWQLPFASVQDPRSLLREFYGITGLPITLLVDKNGKLIERINGPIGQPQEFINRLNEKLISY
jgi:thiol-disulfide isomerase/thioredoxin